MTDPLMRPVEFLVLAVLSEADLHGYGIVQAVEQRTQGRARLKPGNLYRVLERLLQRGPIAEAEAGEVEADGPPRRVYTITTAGRTALSEEARMLRAVVDGVQGSLGDEAIEPAR